jgi:CsoR family transcriptional regulator, copper-sensing transcriptional repressor
LRSQTNETIDYHTWPGYDDDMMTTHASPSRDEGNLPHCPPTPDDGRALPRPSTSYAHDKAKIQARLRRMEGQVRGVQRMVEEDEYCLDVLTQLSAIIAAARQTGLLVLEDHVRGCMTGAFGEGDQDVQREEMLTELIGAIDRFGRTVG